jgi:hypothetical protein
VLEVLAHAPTDLFHCLHCERLFDAADIGARVHQEIRDSYPPEMLEEAEHLAAWLQDLSVRYADRLRVRLVDPQSVEGFLKSLRYGVRRYPAFIVNGQAGYVGWERDALDRVLEEQMANRPWRPGTWASIRVGLWQAVRFAREMLYGMTTFDWARSLRRERAEVERLFVLVTFGELLGLPILPPYYTLRLMPYVVPALNRWKHGLLRERDWTDLTDLIEGVD